MNKNPTELLASLRQFTGTMEYHRHSPDLVLTDGALYLAQEAGAFWFFDIVASVLPQMRRKGQDFLVAKIERHAGKSSATFTIEDGNYRRLYTQEIEYTDFPLDKYEIFVERSDCFYVSLLPSEH